MMTTNSYQSYGMCCVLEQDFLTNYPSFMLLDGLLTDALRHPSPSGSFQITVTART